MYSSNIEYIDLKNVKSKAICGFRRYALYSKYDYGLQVGNFNSRIRFGFVVYKPAICNHEPIRVEIKRVVYSDDNGYPLRLEDIDPKFIKKFVDSLGEDQWELKRSLVVEDCTWYFKGYFRYTACNQLAFILGCTMAARFLDIYGDAFATMLLDHPNVNTATDANEVNDLLISVDAFAREMQDTPTWGTATNAREVAQKECNEIKNTLKKVEEEMNYIYGMAQDYLEVLSDYGIDEKDIEFS